MNEQYFIVYRWYRYCVLCYVVRNIPSSIVFEPCCNVCHITIFLVCTCTLYRIIPMTMKGRVCTTVCSSVHIYIAFTCNLNLSLVLRMRHRTMSYGYPGYIL